MELSKEAKRALVKTTPRRGAPVRDLATIRELFDQDLVTRAGNLTDKGVMVRARVLDEMLEAM